MPYVKIQEGEAFERALRRFTRMCEKTGHLAEIRRHLRYTKPSDLRKKLAAAARRKIRRIKRIQEMGGSMG